MHAVRRISLSLTILLAIVAGMVGIGVDRTVAGGRSAALMAGELTSPASIVVGLVGDAVDSSAANTALGGDGRDVAPDSAPPRTPADLQAADPLPLALTRFNRLPRPARGSDLAIAWGVVDEAGRAGQVDADDRRCLRAGRSSIHGSLVAQHIRLQV